MMSTRGVKFKFSPGEKVLCYEPDPTKAKVLYESKVLDLVANRDARGRKVCEYLIHFYGWNSSWDRYVREEFILPYTDENRELQAKLAEEAALSLKGKKKHKLPPLIKETLSKKSNSKNENHESKQPKSPPHSSSDAESSEDDVEREITIDIPPNLKRVLDEDWSMVTEQDKFIKLPCEDSVVSILDKYIRHFTHSLLFLTPPRDDKNGEKAMAEDSLNSLNLQKEAVDGLRVIFDFTLPHLLLYKEEKKQYYLVGTRCSPIQKTVNMFDLNCCPLQPIEGFRPFFRHCGTKNGTSEEEIESGDNSDRVHTDDEVQLNLKHNVYCKSNNADPYTSTNSEESMKQIEVKHHNQSPKERSPKKLKTSPNTTSTRILRSSEKQKQQPSSNERSLCIHLETVDTNSLSQTSKIPDNPPEPTSPLRVTRKSGQNAANLLNQQQASPSSASCDRSLPNSPTSTFPNTERILPQSHSSNYFSSSNSSTHSNSSYAREAERYQLIHNYKVVKEINDWQIVPNYLYEKKPPPPSLVYGAHHLLRLFVKLPNILSKMPIKQKKLKDLLLILEEFLKYLEDNRSVLFETSAYIDASDALPM